MFAVLAIFSVLSGMGWNFLLVGGATLGEFQGDLLQFSGQAEKRTWDFAPLSERMRKMPPCDTIFIIKGRDKFGKWSGMLVQRWLQVTSLLTGMFLGGIKERYKINSPRIYPQPTYTTTKTTNNFFAEFPGFCTNIWNVHQALTFTTTKVQLVDPKNLFVREDPIHQNQTLPPPFGIECAKREEGPILIQIKMEKARGKSYILSYSN